MQPEVSSSNSGPVPAWAGRSGGRDTRCRFRRQFPCHVGDPPASWRMLTEVGWMSPHVTSFASRNELGPAPSGSVNTANADVHRVLAVSPIKTSVMGDMSFIDLPCSFRHRRSLSQALSRCQRVAFVYLSVSSASGPSLGDIRAPGDRIVSLAADQPCDDPVRLDGTAKTSVGSAAASSRARRCRHGR